jgi:ABC-type molybdate transport system substrate-binding protein
MMTPHKDLPEIPPYYGNDLHNLEYLDQSDLVLFMAGNQFMAMDELIHAFKKKHPEAEKIFYETLPPGFELKQIIAGGAKFKDMILNANPDIYTSVSEDSMKVLIDKGFIGDYSVYLHNRIVLMVRRGNPLGIKNVADLARDDVRISQPGALEDISHHILRMYEESGGNTLVRKITEDKKADGTTLYTAVHHRETPLRLRKGTVDVGPVWATEVINAIKNDLSVEAVEPGEKLDQRHNVNYFIAKVARGCNPANADKFLQFIKSGRAQQIYKNYGFVQHFM